MQDLIEIQSSRYIVPELGKVAAFVYHAAKPTTVPENPPLNVLPEPTQVGSFLLKTMFIREAIQDVHLKQTRAMKVFFCDLTFSLYFFFHLIS